jgi:hypothetical protein
MYFMRVRLIPPIFAGGIRRPKQGLHIYENTSFTVGYGCTG